MGEGIEWTKSRLSRMVLILGLGDDEDHGELSWQSCRKAISLQEISLPVHVRG